jgi:Domain of unknown function (DUF5348)
MSDILHTLVASTNRGRYALDDPEGQDITSGDRIAVWLGGQWIEGSVEHTGSLYANESSGRPERGYYFVASNGGVCGLCTGMRVRLP